MNLCIPCKKMYKCTKTGATISFGNNACRTGDVYTCPGCDHQIITGTGATYHDPITSNHANYKFNAQTMQLPSPSKRNLT